MIGHKIYSFSLVIILLTACTTNTKSLKSTIVKPTVHVDTTHIVKKTNPIVRKKTKLEKALLKQGLVNIQALDSSIQVQLMYSTTDNFVGVDMYADFDQAYLYPEPAQKLLKAQHYLKAIDTTYALIIYDAVRPLHIQQMMWDTLKIPFKEKIKFLSNPKHGSIHNYGAAVDISITKNGKPLDMGTPYDYLGKLAYPRLESQMLKQGKLNAAQISNRKLLRKVMYKAGFSGITTEWWHFNSLKRSEAKRKYAVVK